MFLVDGLQPRLRLVDLLSKGLVVGLGVSFRLVRWDDTERCLPSGRGVLDLPLEVGVLELEVVTWSDCAGVSASRAESTSSPELSSSVRLATFSSESECSMSTMSESDTVWLEGFGTLAVCCVWSTSSSESKSSVIRFAA